MLAWLENQELHPKKFHAGRLVKPEAIAEKKRLDNELLQ